MAKSSLPLDHLTKLSDEELFMELGEFLQEQEQDGSLARPPKASELIAKARGWIEGRTSEISSLVCNNEAIEAAVLEEPTARERIVTLIADAISAAYVDFPVATLAEILFRSGVGRFCEKIWDA